MPTRESFYNFLEKHERKLGIWASHLDNLAVAPAAAYAISHITNDPLQIAAATRAVTLAWDLLASPIIAEGVVYACRKIRGVPYEKRERRRHYWRYQASHLAAHVPEEALKGYATYALIDAGLAPEQAAAVAEGASTLVVQPALNAGFDRLLEVAEEKWGLDLHRYLHNHDHPEGDDNGDGNPTGA